ncbi:MAG: glycosyltransferase [Prevotella sp.]|nr:glycosyltransferase [Prevotella sp.]
MRVLHVISSLEIGGAQRLLSDLLPLQKQQGLDVSLLVLRVEDTAFSKKVENAGVPIISLDVKSFRNPFLAFTVRSIIKDYDVVHAHLVHSLYICSLAARGLKTKLVYTEHSTSNNRRDKSYVRPIEKFIYGRYAKLISISQQTQDALQNWLQSNDERFVVIYNGVDTKAFTSIHREVFAMSLIMVSRFASSKDQETVIRAMQFVKKEATLRLVGDGENLEHCKQVAKECGVEDRVEFLGARADVANLIAESYIGIQSSKWEGFGLTAVEIMACGKPVIATNVDGLKQVVEGAGELFTVGDVEALASIVNGILYDKNRYEKMSNLSKDRALRYDISKTAIKYIDTYKQILS